MMGYGSSYGNGGLSSSSYASNLSPLAPPFTVDRSGPKPVSNPLVDLTEPPPYSVTLNPSLHSFSIPNSQFDSLPSPNAYNPYSTSTSHLTAFNTLASASTDTGTMYPQTSTTLVGHKPYYPSSYVPVPIHDQSVYDLLSTSHVATSTVSPRNDFPETWTALEHTNQLIGLWEGLAEQPQFDGSFCSKENYMTQGFSVSKGMSKYEEISHTIDMTGTEKCIEFASTGKSDYNSFLGENPMFIPSAYSTTSTVVSNSRAPEAYPHAPTLKAANSRNHSIPYNISYEKCSRKLDTSSNDTTSVVKSSRTVVIRPPAQDSCLFKNMSAGNDRDDKNFACSYSSTLKPHQFTSPKGKSCFDAGHLSFQLGQNDNVFAEFCSTKNEVLPRNKDVAEDLLDHCFRERAEIQVAHTSIDCFSLKGDNNQSIDSAESCSEGIDHYNPAVDSPCWKGAVSHLSPFELSGVVIPPNIKNLEACNSSSVQGLQVFPPIADDAVKVSSEKQSENSMQWDNGSLENCFAPSFKRHLVADVLSVQRIDDDVKFGPPHYSKSSYCHGNQIFDDSHKPCEENSMSNKSIKISDFKPSHTEEQSLEEGKWTSKKNCAPRIGVADVGMNRNDGPDDCSSHGPFCAMEHVLCSPASAEDSSAEVTIPRAVESMPKTYAQMLINTMHNLSELLLLHCSKDACELKKEDCEVLKNVINNLDIYVLKNMERTEESLIPQKATSQSLGNLSRLHKGTNAKTPQASGVDAVNFQDQHELQHIQDKQEHNVVSSKKDEKLSNFLSARDAAHLGKDDNMAQAIKKILAENFQGEEESHPQIKFFKNLWLEAEASLCSVNFMARFNRMKIEMDTCISAKANENATVMENLSRSKISSDLLTVNTTVADTKDGPVPDKSIQELSNLSTSIHADDVMARFHTLKCRVDNSDSMNASAADKTSSSMVSPDLNKVEKLALEVQYTIKPNVSIQDSLMPSISRHDAEASVMARYHVLKCQDDKSISKDLKDSELEVIGLRHVDGIRHWPISVDRLEDRILDVNMAAILQSHAAKSNEDKSTVKEFHLFVKDDPETQIGMTNMLGDQPNTVLCDSSSSDWEHVLKEELTGQTC